MIRELRTAAAQMIADDAVRVVVLTGSGDVFCAGGDLKGMQQQAARSRPERVADATELAETLAELDALPKPVVGRINGSAFGGGLGLISICDSGIGVNTARFQLTEVRLGLMPATISPYVVARIGVANARRVMVNATEMDAAVAVRYGLLTESVAAGDLDVAVERVVSLCLKCAPEAVAACKRLIQYVSTHDTPANIAYTAQGLADRWESEELREGIAAFLARRKPAWDKE